MGDLLSGAEPPPCRWPQPRLGMAPIHLDAEEASFLLLADRHVSQRHLFAGRTRRRTHLCRRHSATANARRASSSAPSSLDCSGGKACWQHRLGRSASAQTAPARLRRTAPASATRPCLPQAVSSAAARTSSTTAPMSSSVVRWFVMHARRPTAPRMLAFESQTRPR